MLPELSFSNTHKTKFYEIPFNRRNCPIRINAQMEDIIEGFGLERNFIPVIDELFDFGQTHLFGEPALFSL